MELSIVIPAYNEEDNIEAVIKETLKVLSGLGAAGEIIVVDDGSSDNTLSLLKNLQKQDKRIRLFRHPVNKGLGAALLAGYNQAKGEFVTWIPADRQIHPSQLNKLLNEIKECDFVVSSYIKHPESLIRRIISKIWQFLLRLILQYKIDYNGNYMFRRILFKNFNLKSTTGLVNFEFIYKARAKGYNIKNVLISCQPRLSGKSKVCNFKTIFRTFLEMLKLRFSN